MTYTTYTTRPGDRWDLIANRAYGDVTKMGLLIRENSAVTPDPVLAAGIVLRIPVLIDSDLLPASLLPPWKR